MSSKNIIQTQQARYQRRDMEGDSDGGVRSDRRWICWFMSGRMARRGMLDVGWGELGV